MAKKMRGRRHDLFAELDEGMIALADERQDKRALRSRPVELQAKREAQPSKIPCLKNVGKT